MFSAQRFRAAASSRPAEHCWSASVSSTRTACRAAGAAVDGNTLNAGLPQSWIEIHPDNTILIRVGKPDFGQGTVFTAYRQIVAEELSVPFEAITTVISGDTDRTPDGSGAFDFLGQRDAEYPESRRLCSPGAARFGCPNGSACPRISFP